MYEIPAKGTMCGSEKGWHLSCMGEAGKASFSGYRTLADYSQKEGSKCHSKSETLIITI